MPKFHYSVAKFSIGSQGAVVNILTTLVIIFIYYSIPRFGLTHILGAWYFQCVYSRLPVHIEAGTSLAGYMCNILFLVYFSFSFTCTTVLGLCGSKVLPSSGQVCCIANSAQKWENFNSSSTTGQCFGIISAQFSQENPHLFSLTICGFLNKHI